jgi:hypothetical protein
MLKSVYIDASDRELGHEYLQRVLSFLSLLAETSEGQSYRGMAISTTTFPSDFGPTVQHLNEALTRSRQLGGELRNRVRTVLGGPSPKPLPAGQTTYGRTAAPEWSLPSWDDISRGEVGRDGSAKPE